MKRILTAVGGVALAALIGVTALNSVVDAQTPSSPTSNSDRSSKRDAYLAALAANLGVSPETLQTAIDETSSDLGFGPGMFGRHLRERMQEHRHDRALANADLSGAATFLGITEDELRAELESGKSPLDIAHEHGKTTEEIRAFMIERATERIDARLNGAQSGPDITSPTGA